MADEPGPSLKDIEREAYDRRAELHATMHEIRGRLSPDIMTENIVEYIRGSGGRRLLAAAKANPAAVILAVAGIGWLFFTAQRQEREAKARPSHPSMMKDDQDEPRADHQSGRARLQRWENEGGAQ